MALPPTKRTEGRRLLVLACSSRKSSASGLLPAIERYDGVAYRVVKRLLRLGQFPEDVDILILSTKYRLIGRDHPIQDYDLRMTPPLARQQAEKNSTYLSRGLSARNYGQALVFARKAYLLPLD